LRKLLKLILFSEIVKNTDNGLIKFNPEFYQNYIKTGNDTEKSKSEICKDYSELKKNAIIKATIYNLLINCEFSENGTPFYFTCMLGKYDIFSYFKKYSPNYNFMNNNGTTCLHAAIKNGNKKIINELLAINSNIFNFNAQIGETPLMSACAKKHTELALFLLNQSNSQNSIENQKCLSICASFGLNDVILALLNKNTSIFAQY